MERKSDFTDFTFDSCSAEFTKIRLHCIPFNIKYFLALTFTPNTTTPDSVFFLIFGLFAKQQQHTHQICTEVQLTRLQHFSTKPWTCHSPKGRILSRLVSLRAPPVVCTVSHHLRPLCWFDKRNVITAAIFCFNINEFSPRVCVTSPRWLPQLVWPSQLQLSEETLVPSTTACALFGSVCVWAIARLVLVCHLEIWTHPSSHGGELLNLNVILRWHDITAALNRAGADYPPSTPPPPIHLTTATSACCRRSWGAVIWLEGRRRPWKELVGCSCLSLWPDIRITHSPHFCSKAGWNEGRMAFLTAVHSWTLADLQARPGLGSSVISLEWVLLLLRAHHSPKKQNWLLLRMWELWRNKLSMPPRRTLCFCCCFFYPKTSGAALHNSFQNKENR